jgi:hypothetical protein
MVAIPSFFSYRTHSNSMAFSSSWIHIPFHFTVKFLIPWFINRAGHDATDAVGWGIYVKFAGEEKSTISPCVYRTAGYCGFYEGLIR